MCFVVGDEFGEDEIFDDEGFESGEEDEEGLDVEEDEFDMLKLGKMFKK